jgi:UbiD family decarboxylase
MPYQDFRQFLDVLRQRGHLIEIERPVALIDIGKALKQAYRHPRRPAIIFKQNRIDFPLVCSVYADRQKARDPETGVPVIGHYRFLILEKNRMSFSAQPFHRFGKNLAKCQKMAIKPKAALVIGVDPVLAYTCQAQVPDSTNDWEIAGGWRGHPVELTRCITSDIEGPATSEVVIEFEVDMDELVLDCPLGEYTGYYTPPPPKPVATITAITHRKDPIFQGLLTGKPVTENHILKQIPFEASFFRTLRNQLPTVQNVSVRASAGVSFYVVIYDGAALQGRASAGDPGRDGK